MVVGRSWYLPFDGLAVVERYQVVRTMGVVMRGYSQERHGCKRSEKGAILANMRFLRMELGGPLTVSVRLFHEEYALYIQ